MYYLNKIVWFFLNPVTSAVIALVVGLFLARRWRRLGLTLVAVSVAWLWFASTPLCTALLGLPLERPYLAFEDAAKSPEADAIVVLGGGIGKYPGFVYPDMFEAADRVWHAARLYKAGKAPKIVVSGSGDLVAAVPLLRDLGVDESAIVVDNESRNTYENSRFTERLLGGGKVLLVTSAWHMTRALGNFSRTSLEALPAPCDFKACESASVSRGFWCAIAPGAENLMWTGVFLKEWLGRLARR